MITKLHLFSFKPFDKEVAGKTKLILLGIPSGTVRTLVIPEQDGAISLEGHKHPDISIIAGEGLSGGGSLDKDVTLTVNDIDLGDSL